MLTSAAVRTILRSSATRGLPSRISSSAPRLQCGSTSAFSPSRCSQQTQILFRNFRAPVELSSCVQSLLPYHSATASALLRSKLKVSQCGHYWVLEGSFKPR